MSADVLTRVAALFDTQLAAAAVRWFTGDPARSEMTVALLPALGDLVERPLTIRAFDEPEAHLHPTAQRGIREALTTMGRTGDDLVLATHSPYLLNQRDWSYNKVTEGRVHHLNQADLDATGAFAQDMGLTNGELLATTRLVLIVEGKHDSIFLDELYSEDLHDAGVVVLPMHGTYNAMALLNSEFWLRFSTVPFGLMFDNVRLERLDDGTPGRQLSSEELKLRELCGAVKARGRKVRRVGLERPTSSRTSPRTCLQSRPPSLVGKRLSRRTGASEHTASSSSHTTGMGSMLERSLASHL